MKKWILSILLALVLLISISTPVYAIADPDTPPQVNAVYVYADLLEDGDVGVLIDYYLDYDFTAPITGTPVPTETVTEAYLAIFIDTDTTTQLKSVAPYTFEHSGYGRGMAWIYFTHDEATTYSLDSADIALYSVWLVGNPALAWTGAPPKTVVNIDYWQPAGASAATLLTLRVLYLADQLELAWGLDMIEATALGSRLTTTGAGYFVNVIPNLREMAPSAFSAGEFNPTLENLTYATSFGARMENGTGTVTGSPITWTTEGAHTVTTTVAGTFRLILAKGTVGTIANAGGTVVGGPTVALVAGTNTVTVPPGGTGTLTVTVNRVDTQSKMKDVVAFGATMTNGTGTVLLSPIVLTEGINTVTVTVQGTFTLLLSQGTEGTVRNGSGVVTGSPVALHSGTNTVTVPPGGTGTLTVYVNAGFDLTTLGARFGMSRWMFSGLVWLILSIIICAAVYRISDQGEGIQGSGKIILLVFDICIIGGTVLGLVHPLVAALLFIGFGGVTAYVIFFKGANV